MDQEKMIFSCNGLQFSENEDKPNIIKIEGYAAHFNKANGNAEIVTKNSFKKFLDLMKEKGVPLSPIPVESHAPNCQSVQLRLQDQSHTYAQ